jgi:hypothetical protein
MLLFNFVTSKILPASQPFSRMCQSQTNFNLLGLDNKIFFIFFNTFLATTTTSSCLKGLHQWHKLLELL